MDQQKLRTLVFEKTGVRIDIDDPIFALVALNEAVLAEAVERHVQLLDDATADLADQVQALHDSGLLNPPGHAAEPRPAAALVSAAPPVVHGAPASQQRLVAVAGGAALLCAFVVLAGQALLFRPAPAAAPPIVARELTLEQSAALRDGEKLANIVAKLDPKTRAAIAAEMKKP
ncbi:MAG TPA: hypothetical protein VF800_25035 [Telluria sp.]|jgi:hypothetical protein